MTESAPRTALFLGPSRKCGRVCILGRQIKIHGCKDRFFPIIQEAALAYVSAYADCIYSVDAPPEVRQLKRRSK